jgi:hypothetical protein
MDYSTESVLHTIRRLMAAKGDVRLIISDPGSQQKGANKELISWRKDWDEQMLVRFGAEKSLEWLFISLTLSTRMELLRSWSRW